MALTSIGKILDKRMKTTGLKPRVEAAMVCEKFNELAMGIWGQKVENKIRAMYIKNKLLTVACLSSVLAQEVRLKEARLVRGLNEYFDNEVVQRIRILV